MVVRKKRERLKEVAEVGRTEKKKRDGNEDSKREVGMEGQADPAAQSGAGKGPD
jgi:hypothetical protein